MRYLAGFLLLILAACNSPQIGFTADRSQQVAVGGHRFVVHMARDRAQVVRLNRIRLGQAAEAVAAAKLAAEQASGCKVAQVLDGSDQVLVKVALDCG